MSIFKVGIAKGLALLVRDPITDGSPGGQILQNIYCFHLMSDIDAVKPEVILSNL